MYEGLLGNTDFTMTAFQGGSSVVESIAQWRTRSAEAGAPWIVSFDEPHTIENNPLDAKRGYPYGRTNYLWPTLISGGGSVWNRRRRRRRARLRPAHRGFSRMEAALVWTGHARRFFEQLPLAEMQPRSDLSNAPYALARPGVVYALYAKKPQSVTVDISRASRGNRGPGSWS